jgi:hypothetical protein
MSSLCQIKRNLGNRNFYHQPNHLFCLLPSHSQSQTRFVPDPASVFYSICPGGYLSIALRGTISRDWRRGITAWGRPVIPTKIFLRVGIAGLPRLMRS